MSETNGAANTQPLSESQIDVLLDVVDELLEDVCDSLEATNSPERLVLVMAYILTAVFTTHPELYGEFFQLLAAFEPRYEALVQKFAANFPEAWAERVDGDVFIIQPAIAKALPQDAVNN